MPTASNKVKFQYIGTTVPSTYDGDTIYFDNVNKNIKVGSNIIATNNSAIEFTVSDTNISLRDGTTSLSYTVTSGTNWGNLYTAAQNGDEIILKYNDSVYCKGRITSYDLDDDEGVIYFYWEGFSCYFKVGYNGSATNQIQIVCGSRNLNNYSF